MPYRRVLFLDIDGVVLPDMANFLPHQTRPILSQFDPCAVALLNRACHHRKYKIVIHSSWLRFGNPSMEGTVLDHCISQGLKAGHFHDTEPMASGEIHWRYDRIDDWLSRHPEVNRFWILDDTPPDDGYPRKKHWIACDPDEGITMEVYRKIACEAFVK